MRSRPLQKHTPCPPVPLPLGEPPPTGRELRLLMAILDVKNSGTVTREELEAGLKVGRWAGYVTAGGRLGGDL